MIEKTKGNLLEAPAEALVNTVNTVGVMGKGIALQFRQAYPEMYRAYEKACKDGEVRLGEVQIFDLGGLAGGPRWIINFPTKGHWRANSQLADIENGLADLVVKIRQLRIHSIALPPLGCGNGGLDWKTVRPLIEKAFAVLPDVTVLLFEPMGAPKSSVMPDHETAKNYFGAGCIGWLDQPVPAWLASDPCVSLLEVHKLMYFLKAAGEDLPRLSFEAGTYGPYFPDLRHGLIRMENHLTRGFGEGSDKPTTPVEPLSGAVGIANAFLAALPETRARIDRVAQLIEGYEDPYGMELLSSVHWVMQHNPGARENADVSIANVHDWNDRKRRLLKSEHLKLAWLRLREQKWDSAL